MQNNNHNRKKTNSKKRKKIGDRDGIRTHDHFQIVPHSSSMRIPKEESYQFVLLRPKFLESRPPGRIYHQTIFFLSFFFSAYVSSLLFFELVGLSELALSWSVKECFSASIAVSSFPLSLADSEIFPLFTFNFLL